MMQDIIDLRKNDWVPRREDNNPKTIDQIHKEAAEKAKKTQIQIQMAKQQDKKLRGGFGFGFKNASNKMVSYGQFGSFLKYHCSTVDAGLFVEFFIDSH